MKIEPYSHQKEHIAKLMAILKARGAALDTSDTGTGKTFTALFAGRALGLSPIVVCPKSVVPAWEDACRAMGFHQWFVGNYEKYVRHNTDFYNPAEKSWALPERALLVWDEAHYLKNYKAKRTAMAVAAIGKTPTLFLSATIANRVADMACVGKALGAFSSFFRWMIKEGYVTNAYGNWHDAGCPTRWDVSARCSCDDAGAAAETLRKILYRETAPMASRMRREDIKNLPELFIRTEKVRLVEKKRKAVQAVYEERENELYKQKNELALLKKKIAEGVADAKVKEAAAAMRGHILSEYVHARKIAELSKCEQFVSISIDEINAENSIVVFFAFKESAIKTANALASVAPTGLITGELSASEKSAVKKNICTKREEVVKKFSRDQLRVVVCTIAAGGVGISLHDVRGVHPRIALVNYDWSATNARQAVGRVNRAGAKTMAICRVFYVEGTIEERIVNRVAEKLRTIDAFNDAGEKE